MPYAVLTFRILSGTFQRSCVFTIQRSVFIVFDLGFYPEEILHNLIFFILKFDAGVNNVLIIVVEGKMNFYF